MFIILKELKEGVENLKGKRSLKNYRADVKAHEMGGLKIEIYNT